MSHSSNEFHSRSGMFGASTVKHRNSPHKKEEKAAPQKSFAVPLTSASVGDHSDADSLDWKRFEGKTVVIIGAGVGGLTTAYEILKQSKDRANVEVLVLEARDRTGGRCLTLRTGDTLTEDVNSNLKSEPSDIHQMVRFEHVPGDSEPYLNAGPGRIPSTHILLLKYMKEFGVPLEVYVHSSSSNMTYTNPNAKNEDEIRSGENNGVLDVNRRYQHNARGHFGEMLYQRSHEIIHEAFKKECCGLKSEEEIQNDCPLKDELADFRSLLIQFADLVDSGENIGKYVIENLPNSSDHGHTRAGYLEVPGVTSGKLAPIIPFIELLKTKFWGQQFYQDADILWQPTSMQPVGGMDRVQHAFAQQVAANGGTILLNSPVNKIAWNDNKFQVSYQTICSGEIKTVTKAADFCFCNCAMPFLQDMIDSSVSENFAPEFKAGLEAVYNLQATGSPTKKFLANTTKVGWQADRSLWETPAPPQRVTPIFGGISWVQHPITQIWYPSNSFHDTNGILTGCYNYGTNAEFMGGLKPSERLVIAEQGARLIDGNLADGFRNGVAIAWQNMAYIKGGWTQWQYVEPDNEPKRVEHFNGISEATSMEKSSDNPIFFIVGDQISSLPGWQEGAIASARKAVHRLFNPDADTEIMLHLPDTRLMVEGQCNF